MINQTTLMDDSDSLDLTNVIIVDFTPPSKRAEEFGLSEPLSTAPFARQYLSSKAEELMVALDTPHSGYLDIRLKYEALIQAFTSWDNAIDETEGNRY